MRNLTLFIITCLSLVFFLQISTSSCASRSAPTGGPRDTIAPILDTSYPANQTLRFEAKEVTLVFDEYITLKSANQQISVSPLLKNPPKITSKGKTVTINWENDTLLENTTYIISFGSSITDFTEGNINQKIKYVFSTGDYIDSLHLTGSIIDVENGEPVDHLFVGLYDVENLKSEDSIPFKNLPTYYAYTNEQGVFSITNMKYGSFYVVAFEDSRGSFKMNSGYEKMAFLKDTIHTGLLNERLYLTAFRPQSPNRFYGARHVNKGKIEVAFSYTPKNLKVTPIDTAVASSFHFFDYQKDQDTATFWFDEVLKDSIKLVVEYDSIHVDTVLVTLNEYDAQPFEIWQKGRNVKFDEPSTFKVNAPIKNIYDSLFTIYTETDTVSAAVETNPSNPLEFTILPTKQLKKYTVKINKDAIKSVFNQTNDTMIVAITTLSPVDLGNLVFKIDAESEFPLVVQVRNPLGELIIDSTFYNSLKLRFKNMLVGVYEVQIIVDENGDGKWSTGNYLEGRQPEKIVTFEDEMEIRANWDLELEWQPDFTKPQKSKAKPSRSVKN